MRIVALLVGLMLWLAETPAEAHHNQYLPALPTPLMRNLWGTGEVTYCFDQRSAAYPGFAAQFRDVAAGYLGITGIPLREVAFDANCQLKNVMPSEIACEGWAARVFYANWPVTVEYCWPLAYTDWRSAQGHELGHALLGLHEQYRDTSGIGCTGRQDTVMDCGSGVRYPTPRDRDLGWAVLLPHPVATAGIAFRPDGAYLYYEGKDNRAGRVAVIAIAPWGEWYFTGNWLSGERAELRLVSEPGWCFAANSEIAPWVQSWARGDMRNDVLFGCV